MAEFLSYASIGGYLKAQVKGRGIKKRMAEALGVEPGS